MRVSRPLAALACAVSAGVGLAACQDQAAGTITAHDGVRTVQSFTNPSIGGATASGRTSPASTTTRRTASCCSRRPTAPRRRARRAST
ncbi:hypothetical protein H4K36_21480 [Streptomyces sp. DHE7-1]|nr:hypothetical protein [Streptomyces sp. DHE7-1]